MKKTDDISTEIDISQLSSIRSSKGQTVESLAEKLKVTRDFVKYIESGDFGKLGAPTFVKGHVSNYCKALDIPYETVLNQIPQQFLQNQTFQSPDALGVSPLAKVRRRSNHLGRYAVGTALLGMLALSFYFVWDKWSLPGQNAQPGSQLAELNNNEKKNGKNVTYSSLIPQVKMQENQVEQSDEPVNDSMAEEHTDENEQQSIDPEGSLNLSAETSEEVTTNADSEQALNAVQTQALYSIELQLTEDAWVSIKSEDGSNIEHNLVKAGSYTYQSDQSMHFRIGNAKQAQVTINNQVIELSEHMKRDIADFNWPNNPG